MKQKIQQICFQWPKNNSRPGHLWSITFNPRQAWLTHSSRCEVTFGMAPGQETGGEWGWRACLFWNRLWETLGFKWQWCCPHQKVYISTPTGLNYMVWMLCMMHKCLIWDSIRKSILLSIQTSIQMFHLSLIRWKTTQKVWSATRGHLQGARTNWSSYRSEHQPRTFPLTRSESEL